MKTTSCTEPRRYAFEGAPRCGARSKRNNGDPCRSPAVRGKHRCRIHGGSKGSGAQIGNQNAVKHGYTTKEAKAQREQIRTQIKLWKKFEEEIDLEGG